MGVQHTANVRVVLVHGRVHRDHGALDGRQVTLERRPVQTDPHHGGWCVASERRAPRPARGLGNVT
jgi:hypothetical protein